MKRRSAIIIGAGIVGLAMARALAVRGYSVTVIERNQRAIGASIRNFGMIWPIGQPDGKLYERAMLSRGLWKDVCADAGIWYEEAGSLHLAYNQEEWNVLSELRDIYRNRSFEILDRDKTMDHSKAASNLDLIGGLYSPHEMIVDPRQAISAIPAWLTEKYGVIFKWSRVATMISYPSVWMGKSVIQGDEIYVCSGEDLNTLYPELFAELPLAKCKLQMMRMKAQPDHWRIGPALCGGLSLVHYVSFKAASSLTVLNERYKSEYGEYLKYGIHVMAAQNMVGEITVGDSHEYSSSPDPFDKYKINKLILEYLKKFARFKDETVVESWNGVYAKLTDGLSHIILTPEQGVTCINGLGGAGMTLSFGLCEQLVTGVSLQ